MSKTKAPSQPLAPPVISINTAIGHFNPNSIVEIFDPTGSKMLYEGEMWHLRRLLMTAEVVEGPQS